MTLNVYENVGRVPPLPSSGTAFDRKEIYHNFLKPIFPNLTPDKCIDFKRDIVLVNDLGNVQYLIGQLLHTISFGFMKVLISNSCTQLVHTTHVYSVK